MKLDGAITAIQGARMRRAMNGLKFDDLDEAIRILESRPKYEPLIKAAEGVGNNKNTLLLGLDLFTDILDDEKSVNGEWKRDLKRLISAIPEER